MAVIEWKPVTWQLYNDYLENARFLMEKKLPNAGKMKSSIYTTD